MSHTANNEHNRIPFKSSSSLTIYTGLLFLLLVNCGKSLCNSWFIFNVKNPFAFFHSKFCISQTYMVSLYLLVIYILDINFIWFMLFKCFPPLCGMSFHFLNVDLKNKICNFDDVHFTNIPLCGLTLCVLFKSSLPNSKTWWFSPMHSSGSFITYQLHLDLW